MTSGDVKGVTELLVAWSDGDHDALEQLVPLVQNELRRVARRYMARERTDHTLQTTALVNEAYLRLVDQEKMQWQNRAHFFAIAARLMRRILVDHARTRGYQKRGAGAARIALEDAPEVPMQREPDLIALDDALTSLASIDPRKNQIVELRYFGGLSVEETAEVMGVSSITVAREWRSAKAWLYRELRKANHSIDE